MEPYVQFFGRLHPMVLHAPIGMLIALIALEALGALRRRPLSADVRTPLVWLVALSAVVTAGTGFVLGQSDEFEGDLVDLHRILGIAGAIACVVAALVQQRAGSRGAYYATLAVAAGVITVAGHQGAGITHGVNFLFEPFDKSAKARPAQSDAPASTGPATESPAPSLASQAPSEFVRVVRPILEKRCFACHGAEKKKGGLSLHTPEAILRGGDFGPIVTPGHPEASEIVRRLRLDIDDDEHMPPSGKSQPSEADIKAVEDWIAAGAPMSEVSSAPAGDERGGSAAAPAEPAEPGDPPAPNGPAIAALRDRLVHVAPISAGSALLSVDLGVAPGLTEADAVALLKPLRENIEELRAARAAVGDDLAALCAGMPRLRKLDLSGTGVTDAGVKAIAGHRALTDLVLTRARLGDASAAAIASIGSLERVYLWNSGVSAEAAASLRANRKDLLVNLGDEPLAAVLEQEPAVKLSSDAPGAPKATATEALRPANTACPVSGEAVDDSFLLVHKGRVVGFCCRHCVGKFLEDPAKFEGKIQ